MPFAPRLAAPFAAVFVLAAIPACSQPETPYTPQAAFSGRKATMPGVPTLPNRPIKVADAYTVYGATHHLRSRVHVGEVKGKELSITGYVVKTNLAEAPACAVHKTGKGDKDDCKSPIPAFWIADEKGDEKNAIKVMGWASNFANVFDAVEKYSAAKTPADVKELVKDEFWGVELPNPLPVAGAKVIVTGTYDVSFSKSTGGVETDPLHGILTYGKVQYLEPPTEKATLPGMAKH